MLRGVGLGARIRRVLLRVFTRSMSMDGERECVYAFMVFRYLKVS